MRILNDEQLEIWRSEDKTGSRRPIARATVQSPYMAYFPFDTGDQEGGDFLHRIGQYTSLIFGNPHPLREIPNILQITWSRSVEQDVAQGEITLLNSNIVPIGSIGGDAEDFELPGAFSPTRGGVDNPWGYAQEGWRNAIIPDAIIRTYEGYGCDPSVWPAQDTNLQASGTWLVDDVIFSSSGDIVVKVRDIGRQLLDQVTYWDVIPVWELPLQWSKRVEKNRSTHVPVGGGWHIPRGVAHSSNTQFVGLGLTEEDGGPYVNANGGWRGHLPKHALNTNDHSFWMSTGYRWWDDHCWWGLEFAHNQRVAAVRTKCAAGAFLAFISLKGPDGWIGKKKIPLIRRSVHGVDQAPLSIPYVMSAQVAREHWTDIVLKQSYKNISEIRITFHSLKDVPLPSGTFEGSEWGHFWRRAGLKQVQVYTGAGAHVVKDTETITEGNYDDYTDIVKKICAWGGLFWPEESTGRDYIQSAPGVEEYYHQPEPDDTLVRGRAWGDFQQAGTAGVADLTADLFDKQPLWESIAQVRDILGFLAYIEETGAMVWRPPNTWKLGNYITPGDLSERGVGRVNGADALLTISEDDVLQDYKMTLTSRNLREKLLIANPKGKPVAYTHGYSKSGLRRMAGFTDVNLETQGEVEAMADLMAARQMFSYRLGEPVMIPGNPAIQIDDQVKIIERVTSETYYHRVVSISSSLNMRDGVWTYQMGTHWIGDSATGVLVAEAATITPGVGRVLAGWGVL